MKTVFINRVRIPEKVVKGKRLGRNVHHDSRSLAYGEPKRDQATNSSIQWERKIPILDQGNVGACVGNAAVGALGTEPFYSTLATLLAGKSLRLDEDEALSIYSVATQLDDYNGTYPPDDTGSDGLSGAKACQRAGLISGYVHSFSVADMISGLQFSPLIVGTNWYDGFDQPTSTGLVKPTGSVRGGHEYECYGVDLSRELFYFDNSWNTDWGLNGTFNYSFDTMQKLLDEQGDATRFIPLSAPAPEPTPPIVDYDAQLIAAMDPWAETIESHNTHAGKAKDAYEAWKANR